MSRRPRPGSAQQERVAPAAPAQAPASAGASSNAMEVLADLHPGVDIVVRRTVPSYAKGFCGTHQMPEGGPWELVEQIERSWGGGTFVLQPRSRSPMYGNRFGTGGCQIEISGTPKHHGNPYTADGRLMVSAPEAVAAPSVVMQSPATSPNPLQTQIFGLLQQLVLKSDGKTGGGFALGDVLELARVMQSTAAPQAAAHAPVEEFGQLERMVSLYAKLQRVFGGGGVEREATGGGFGGLENMMGSPEGMMQMMFMRMMMGGGGLPGMPGMGAPAMGAPAQQSTIPAPAQTIIAPSTPAAATPSPAHVAPVAAAAAPRVVDFDDDGPPTADDLVDDLEQLDVEQRATTLRAVLERQPEAVREKLLEQLGLNADNLDSMFRKAAAGLSSDNGWPKAAGG